MDAVGKAKNIKKPHWYYHLSFIAWNK